MVSCLLCGFTSTDNVDTKIRHDKQGRLKVYQCPCCGVQFLYPRGSSSELADYYNGEYRKEYVNGDYYSREEMDKFFRSNMPEAESRVSRVERWLQPSDEIAEIGCASGYFLAAISSQVKVACGTEWDLSNARYAAERGYEIRRLLTDFNQKFDKIFMFHVLEHIEDPIAFLRDLQPSLRLGGMVFVEVPNRDDVLLSTYEIESFRDFYYQTAHLWYFNRSSLDYVAREAGYEAVIQPLQRYDLSNHIHWLRHGLPGGHRLYSDIFTDECNQEYIRCLERAWKTDTLFCSLIMKNR